MKLNQIVKAGLITVAAALSFSAQAGSNGITVSIAPEKAKLGAKDDVSFTVTMKNTSAKPQFMLKWNTPFGDEIEESLFDITRDGVKVAYQGAHYKRPSPTAADYYVLKPGATHTMKVELSGMYDMSITGDYAVRYHTRSFNLFSTDLDTRGVVSTEKELGEVQSDTVSIWIDGRLPRGSVTQKAAAPINTAVTGSLSFNKCTASQQADITTARTQALTYATDADAYMGRGTAGPRYTKWFGANDSARFSAVKSHYIAIKDAFTTKPITVDCGCKKTYYAYVFPTQPYTIYVCKAFWTAPMVGTDSKGGTLVHEMSHFNATAGTDDWVYGQTGAASLAISDPAKATDNADSHEYFGENNPAQQ
ncbi:MAG: M35 family metallo-endopeptidase [Pseudomonadota bacterium]